MHTLFFLVLSALLEIAGCQQYYQYFINHKSPRRLVTGTITLVAFGWACSQPSLPNPSYIYAGYAGIYAAVAILLWMPLVDGETPSTHIIMGSLCYLLGSMVILWPYLRG